MTMNHTPLEPVIGLEVHVQLSTLSKIFCACSTAFGSDPNDNTCPVCLGLPGSLPVLNERALELGIKIGLALNCDISPIIKFDRKNYFYPDLPKAFQISQYDMPVAKNGFLILNVPDGNQRKIGITRAHLEEDAGKLLHEGAADASLVDYNRAGVPLMEIVSEPEIVSPAEAYEYLSSLKAILEYLEVSDCNMEEGSLRCDANVSMRPAGEKKLGTKVEIKNLNSFRAVEKALAYEIERQSQTLLDGGVIIQETRLWNEASGQTLSMRSKEFAHDYRYFPEPDLVPSTVDQSKIDEVRSHLPELPANRYERFKIQYGLSDYDGRILVSQKEWADFFEAAVKVSGNAKLISNWFQSELLGGLNARKMPLKQSPVGPQALAELVRLIEDGTISGKIGKEVLGLMIETGKPAAIIIEEKGLRQISDASALQKLVDQVIASNPKTIEQIKAGKKQALGFLVGQIMKETRGTANPAAVNDILKQRLG